MMKCQVSAVLRLSNERRCWEAALIRTEHYKMCCCCIHILHYTYTHLTFDKDRTLQNVPSLYPHSTFYTHYTCHVLLHSTVPSMPCVCMLLHRILHFASLQSVWIHVVEQNLWRGCNAKNNVFNAPSHAYTALHCQHWKQCTECSVWVQLLSSWAV